MASECVSNSPITEEDIDRLLDGEHHPQLIEHLKQCSFCKSRYEEAYAFEIALIAQTHRRYCPSPDVIAAIAINGSFGETFSEDQEIQQHIQSCTKCQADLEMAREFLMNEPPAELPLVPPIMPMPSTPRSLLPIRKHVNMSSQSTQKKAARTFQPMKGFRAATNPRISTKSNNDDVIEIGKVRVRFHYRRREGDILSIFGQLLDDDVPELWVDTLLRVYSLSTLVAIVPLNDLCEFRCKVIADVVNLSFTAKDGRAIIIDGVTAFED